jgi:hypothetical protein
VQSSSKIVPNYVVGRAILSVILNAGKLKRVKFNKNRVRLNNNGVEKFWCGHYARH